MAVSAANTETRHRGTRRARSVGKIVIHRSAATAGVDVRFPPVLVRAGWHCGGMKESITGVAALDDERRYQAAVSKDPRFDGVFFTAVTSTGIYCRPSCPAITPKRANMRFYRSAAAAQEAGFRACKRCRPDASPGSPEWNIRADVVGRAMRLIADGVVDRDGVEGLARRLGYEQRQVRRLVTAELGAGPLAIARAQRAQTARILVETTALPLSEIAFAAGFASIRQFNATIREVFAVTPTQLREARGRVQKTRRLLPPPAGAGRSRADPHAAGLPGPDRRGADAGLPGRPGHPRGGGGHATAGTGGPSCCRTGRDLVPLRPRPRRRLRRLRAPARGPARPDRRGAALPTAARPGRGPRGRHRLPVGRPGARAAGPGQPGTALARARRRQRTGAAGGARPAGLGGRGPAARGAAGGRLRQAAIPPGRPADALLPRRPRRWPPPIRPRCRCRAAGRWP